MAENAIRDENYVTSILLESSTNPGVTVRAKGDQVTGRLLVDNSGGGSGTVTSIAGGVGITLTPDPITTTGTVAIANTAVTPGSYTLASITVDQQGRITSASNGSVGAGDVVGPASATDNAIARFDGTTGKIIQNSAVTIADTSGNITGGTYNGNTIGAGSTSGTNTGDQTSVTGNAGTLTVANEATDTSCFIGFWTAASGTLPGSTNTNMTFNSNTGVATFASTVLTTTDINGGTVDGTVIGGASAAAATVTTATVNTSLTMADAANIIVNATTGTKIGTATSQKLAFYNSTPIVQPTGDVVTALQNLGLVASATIASSTNINTATESTDTTCFPVFVTASGTQTLPAKTNTTLTYNSNTNDLGVTKINGLTITASTGTFTLTNAKTFAVTNTLTLSGTDSTVMTFPTTTATIARTDAGQTFTGVQVMTSPSITTANLTGTQLLAENASIGLDPAGSADGKFTGLTVTATAGYTQAFGDLVYLDPTDSRWEATDANSAAGADGDARGLLGMVVVAGTDGNACTVLLQGIIRADAKFPSFTINNPIYVSETAGLVTQTQPTTTDVVIRVVGSALTADEMYFNPSYDYITHV